MLRLWLRLWLEAMGGDLMNLPWSCHIHHVIGLHLNFVARWQEGIEAHDQVRVTFEELRDAADHSWSVNTLRLEFFHYVQEIIVDLRLTPKLQLHLIKIGQCILHLKPLKLLLPLHWCCWRGRVSMTLYHLASMRLHRCSVMVSTMDSRYSRPMTA